MLQKVVWEKSVDSELSSFLEGLWWKIKKVYLQINEDTLSLIAQDYPVDLINDIYDWNEFCDGLDWVVRWESASYNWLKEKETNKNHVLAMKMIVEEFWRNFPPLLKKLEFQVVHEEIEIHDIGEMWPWDRTQEQKNNSNKNIKAWSDKLEERYALMIIWRIWEYGISQEKIKYLKSLYLYYEKNKTIVWNLEENFVKFVDAFQWFLYVNFEIIDEKILKNTKNEEIKNKLETSWNLVMNFYTIFQSTLVQEWCNINILGDLEKITELVKKWNKEGIKKCLIEYNTNIMNCIKI